MLGTPPYNEELLDAPLRHIEFTGQRLCVAESAQGTSLVLFTSSARGHDFAQRDEAFRDSDAVSPTLRSFTRAEFRSRVEVPAAGQSCGFGVDPHSNGQVGHINVYQIGSRSGEPN